MFALSAHGHNNSLKALSDFLSNNIFDAARAVNCVRVIVSHYISWELDLVNENY